MGAELQRQDRRMRRQERERQEWDAQETAIRSCEERLEKLSEFWAVKRKPATCNRRLASAAAAPKARVADLPLMVTATASDSTQAFDAEALPQVAASLRALGYDDLGRLPGATAGTDMLLQASMLDTAAQALQGELRELAAQLVARLPYDSAVSLPSAETSARDWVHEISTLLSL